MYSIGEMVEFIAKELKPPELVANVSALVGSMRTRQLRSYLVKLGADRLEVDKMMLREELVSMAQQLVEDENAAKYYNYNTRVAFYVTVLLGVLVFAYVLKDLFLSLVESILQFFGGEMYQIQIKIRTLRMAIKNSRYMAILGLLLSVLCDCLVNGVQISIMASWVLPRESFLRQYMIRTFSLPMSPQQLLGMGSNFFTLDVGPMITLWGLRWLSKQFEEVVGSSLIDIVDKKWSKKQKRMNAHRAKDSYARSGTFFDDDSPFLRTNNGEEDLDSIKKRFFGTRGQSPSKRQANATAADSPNPGVDDFSSHTPDFLKKSNESYGGCSNSILEERDESDILEDAAADGSSAYCEKCGDLVKADRMDVHLSTWCSMNDAISASDTVDID